MDSQKISKVTPTLAEELSRYIRLLAKAGKNQFHRHLYKPLVYAGWERQMKYNDSKFIMARIENRKNRRSTRRASLEMLDGTRIFTSLVYTKTLGKFGDVSLKVAG